MNWQYPKHTLRLAFVMIIIVFSISTHSVTEAQAAVFTPGCTNGVGDSEQLIMDVEEANSNGVDDTIQLVGGCIYQLSREVSLDIYPDRNKTLTIQGNGATVRGNQARVVVVYWAGRLNLEKVTITNGYGGLGGGIRNAGGVVRIKDSFITGNWGTRGGGINIEGSSVQLATLELINTVVSSNRAKHSGGGIYIGENTIVTLTKTIISSNKVTGGLNSTPRGGGIYVNDNSFSTVSSRLTITNTLVSDNSADEGGGLALNNGWVEAEGLIIHNNRASWGGGVFNTAEILRINNSTVSANQAYYAGGGLFLNSQSDSSQTLLFNVTLAENVSRDTGGGLYNSAVYVVLNHVTISRSWAETGGGIANYGKIILRNTIVADSQNSRDCHNESNIGQVLEDGVNLIEDRSCDLPKLLSGDPLLGELTGSPAYLPLLPGSPAIDIPNVYFCFAKDQRGVARPQDGNGDGIATCDLGAYELDAVSLVGASQTPLALSEVTSTGTAPLLHGDFEQTGLNPWKGKGETKLKCNREDNFVAYEGKCAARLGEGSGLVQKIEGETLTLRAGDTLRLSLAVNGSDANVSGWVKLSVSYSDPSLPSDEFRLELRPTAGYEVFVGQLTLTRDDVTEIKVQINLESGKAYVDAVSLQRIESGQELLPLP
jgi:predicted outer membrane repeat protein